jgi:hypothetical protein
VGALLAAATALLSIAAASEPPSPAIASGAPGPKRVYVATRLTGAAPRIDGKLDDPCWAAQGDWAGDYTQFMPSHGGAPSEPSQLKVLYDSKYLYVAIRAFDHHPEQMTRFAAPRDQFTGDIVGITFDSYFDHRTAFEFDLTSAGQKLDVTLTNDGWDTTWNAVWDGKVSYDDRGWSAEMRIPLSQLRYNDRHPQIWGMHSWRWLARNSEESQWKLLANDGTGLVYSFGELHGLELPKPRRHLELVPYASARATHRDEVPAGARHTDPEVAAGLDAKLQLSTAFTLDATVNPDFGQVEADPSQMNLTAFETFLEERRPFFIEGKDILQFSLDDDDPLFYSRRIGHAPSLPPPAGSFDIPESTSILAAWKITGKTASGLSLGVLHAATDEEHARYRDATGTRTVALEPAAQYFLARVEQELDRGQTTFGGVAAATVRSPKSDALRDLLPRQSFAGGVDFERYWDDRTYSFTAKAVGTHVAGTPAAIAALQTSSARYFQRPDADYVAFDPDRRRLDGWAAYLMAGKRSKGHWRYHEKLTAYSPGVEFNDLGYLREADRVKQHTELAYVEKEPASFYRDFEVGLENNNYWDFGGDHLRSELVARAFSNLKNKTYVETELTYTSEALDPVALRGGPALRVPASIELSGNATTDAERTWVAAVYADATVSEHHAYRAWYLSPRLKFRPTTALTFSVSAERTHETNDRQYVPARTATGNPAYIVSALRSDSLTYTLRAQWFLRPELSIQYYGSPFGSSGTYARFARVLDPRNADFAARAQFLPAPTSALGRLFFDDNADGRPEYDLDRPDFAFGQFRSNLVLRWEFRPGSNLYLVWSEERSETRPDPAGISRVIGRLRNTPATDVLLVKFSYWFSL